MNRSWRKACDGIAAMTLAAAFIGGVPSISPAERLHGNTIIVFDGSGSMWGLTDDPSRSFAKGAVARAAADKLVELLGQAPALEAGLVVFGARMDQSTTPREQGCQDISVEAPRGPLTPAAVDRMRRAIQAVTPRGRTPLGRSVELAQQMLGPTGGSIVVVTDMEETCEEPTDFHDACEAFARANRGRGPADRVYVDSIIVTRAPNMNMEAVQRLRQCTGAPVLEIVNDVEANRRAAEVAARLIALSRQGDRQLTEGRAVFLNGAGGKIIPTEVELRFIHEPTSRETRVAAPDAARNFALQEGKYTVVVERARRKLVEHQGFVVTDKPFEVFLTIDE